MIYFLVTVKNTKYINKKWYFCVAEKSLEQKQLGCYFKKDTTYFLYKNKEIAEQYKKVWEKLNTDCVIEVQRLPVVDG